MRASAAALAVSGALLGASAAPASADFTGDAWSGRSDSQWVYCTFNGNFRYSGGTISVGGGTVGSNGWPSACGGNMGTIVRCQARLDRFNPPGGPWFGNNSVANRACLTGLDRPNPTRGDYLGSVTFEFAAPPGNSWVSFFHPVPGCRTEGHVMRCTRILAGGVSIR